MAQGIVNLPFNVAAYGKPNGVILNGITDGSAGTLGLVAGDQLQLVLYPRNVSGTPGAATTTQRINVGSSIAVAGKLQSSPSATTVLFSALSFTESQDGSSNWLYTGYLDLNKTELLTALGTSTSIAVMLVLDVVDATGKPQRYLVPITVYAPYYLGSEASPTPATPAFLTALQTEAGFVANWNFITDLSGGISTSLNAQPTLGVVAFGTQVAMRGIAGVNGGGYTIWEYTNTSTTGAGYVRPLDYDGSANVGAWVKVL